MTLIFETHSSTADNERGIASGHRDIPLSAVGFRQARELGTRYLAEPPDIVYTSDLLRARQTAFFAFRQRLTIRADRRLRECNYGALTGAPISAIAASRLAHVDNPYPEGGESYTDVLRRVRSLLNDLPATECTLIIGHRATWYALEHLLNARPLPEVIAAPWQWQPGWRYHLDQPKSHN